MVVLTEGDAWGIPGWTAQNPNYPPLALPAQVINLTDVAKVHVTGSFADGYGNPINGWVYVSAPITLWHASTSTDLMSIGLRGEIKMDGSLAMDLPANDDANLTPHGWLYHFRIVLKSHTYIEFDAGLPTTPSTVSIHSLYPVDPETTYGTAAYNEGPYSSQHLQPSPTW